MEELLLLLEQLGITLVKDAEAGLIATAKSDGLLIINDIIEASEQKLMKLKVLRAMETVGHGKLRDDVKIGAVEAEIEVLKVAAQMLQA